MRGLASEEAGPDSPSNAGPENQRAKPRPNQRSNRAPQQHHGDWQFLEALRGNAERPRQGHRAGGSWPGEDGADEARSQH